MSTPKYRASGAAAFVAIALSLVAVPAMAVVTLRLGTNDAIPGGDLTLTWSGSDVPVLTPFLGGGLATTDAWTGPIAHVAVAARGVRRRAFSRAVVQPSSKYAPVTV